MKCPYCAEEIADGSKKCPVCKENLTNTCKFCKEEIADGAIKCRHCGSMQSVAVMENPTAKTTYTSYDQVPFFRKNWFIILTFFIMPVITVIVFSTGDAYYTRKGKVQKYHKMYRYLSYGWMVVFLIRVAAN